MSTLQYYDGYTNWLLTQALIPTHTPVIKVVLLNNTATFNAAHTTKAQVDGGSSATVTITSASPGVVTHTAHGKSNGQPVVLDTTGALWTGLAVRTPYYLVNVTTNTYQLAATSGGSAINTSGSQSGVHTAYYSGANEVYGNGWAPGGAAFTGLAVATYATKNAKATATAIGYSASGGPAPSSPAYKALIFDDAAPGKTPLAFDTFDSGQSAGDGTNGLINVPSTGLFPVTAP